MLLQEILHQLDAELDRLQALRAIVADLAALPVALRRLPPQLGLDLNAETAASPEPKRKRGRPRKSSAPAPSASAAEVAQAIAPQPAKPQKPSRPKKSSGSRPLKRKAAEPEPLEAAVLGRTQRSGPVVVSAAALLREREERAAAKAAAVPGKDSSLEPEVRPELFARELAARWLTPAGKG